MRKREAEENKQERACREDGEKKHDKNADERYQREKREREHTEDAVVPQHRLAPCEASREYAAEQNARVHEGKKYDKRIRDENEQRDADADERQHQHNEKNRRGDQESEAEKECQQDVACASRIRAPDHRLCEAREKAGKQTGENQRA